MALIDPPSRRPPRPSRRAFHGLVLPALAAGGAVAAPSAPTRRGIPLGFDNFAVRATGWNARRLVDHADSLGCDALFITDFGPLEGKFDDRPLTDLRAYAADRGVAIELGSWSICPTSTTFKADWGSAEEHLALGIRMATALGSPAFRVILGNQADRTTPGGIEARIADTVKVLRSQRSRAIDAGERQAILARAAAAVEGTLVPQLLRLGILEG